LIHTVAVPASGLFDRKAIHECEDAADLPSAEYLVHHAAVVQKHLPFANGQMVNRGGHKPPALVEIRHCVVFGVHVIVSLGNCEYAVRGPLPSSSEWDHVNAASIVSPCDIRRVTFADNPL